MGRSRKLEASPKRKPAAVKHTDRCEVLTLDALHDTRGKPKYDMRTMARCAIGRGKKTQEDIRNALEAKFPGIDPDGHGAWKQTLRHTLSNYHCFVRVPRPEHEPGKGDYWKVVGDSKESRSQKYKKCVRSAKASARSASTSTQPTVANNTLDSEDVSNSGTHVTIYSGHDDDGDDCCQWDDSLPSMADVTMDTPYTAAAIASGRWRAQRSISAPGLTPEISAMRDIDAFVSAPLARNRYNTSRLVWDNSAASDGLDDYTRSSRYNLPGTPFVPYHPQRREAYSGTLPGTGLDDPRSLGLTGGNGNNPYFGIQALPCSAFSTRHKASHTDLRWTLEEDRRRQGEHLPPDPAQLSTSTSSTGTGGNPAATLSPARKLSYLLN